MVSSEHNLVIEVLFFVFFAFALACDDVYFVLLTQTSGMCFSVWDGFWLGPKALTRFDHYTFLVWDELFFPLDCWALEP